MFSKISLAKLAMLLTTLLLLSACGNSAKNNYPHTGDPDEEVMSGDLVDRASAVVGKTFYIVTETLYVRSSDEIVESNILGRLHKGDKVSVVNNSSSLAKEFVEVEIVASAEKIAVSDHYYVSYKYLESKPSGGANTSSRYIIIQNIATERLRVYERTCPDGSCLENKLVLEATIAAGEDDPERRTFLGSYYIREWKKFYQDQAGNYPSWYDPSLPKAYPPAKGSGISSWLSSSYLRAGQSSGMRGAFGWYTALMAPNPMSQWMHGTIGWGEESKGFINKTKGFFVNVFSDPRSHGCSRTDNQTIAFLRQILEVGTPVIKIYAKETNLYSEAALKELYPVKQRSWEYILTKNGVRIDGQKADADSVRALGVSSSEILEQGTYILDTYPNPVTYSGTGFFFGSSSNIYKVNEKNLHGVFFADAGVVCQYRHPESLKVAGKADELVPSYMVIHASSCDDYIRNGERNTSQSSGGSGPSRPISDTDSDWN